MQQRQRQLSTATALDGIRHRYLTGIPTYLILSPESVSPRSEISASTLTLTFSDSYKHDQQTVAKRYAKPLEHTNFVGFSHECCIIYELILKSNPHRIEISDNIVRQPVREPIQTLIIT